MEKRKFSRSFTGTSINLYKAAAKKKEIITGSVLNVSKGGVFIAYFDKSLINSFRLKQKLCFDFAIPTGKVEGIGEIVWVDKAELQIGLKFTSIKNKNGLSNLIDFITCDFCGYPSAEIK
jgi:hypothetical protein